MFFLLAGLKLTLDSRRCPLAQLDYRSGGKTEGGEFLGRDEELGSFSVQRN